MIGGDFQLNDELLKSKSIGKSLQETFKNTNFILTDTGRSALALALLEIKRKYSIKKAWLPLFSCHSISHTFSHCGFEINYYGMGSNLNNPNGLSKVINNAVIFFIHYFGKKNNEMIDFLNDIKDRNQKIIIIEDLVHTCLSSQFGEYGDYSIHSLRKFLPVPDGGILTSRTEVSCNFEEPNENFISYKVLSKLLRGFTEYDEIYLELEKKGESIIDSKIVPREISNFTKIIFQKININSIQSRRIKNWKELNVKIRNNDSLSFTPLFNYLSDGEVPLGFPVLVKGCRDNFRKYLITNNIYCPIHWELKHIKSNRYYEDVSLSSRILTIPIDQRMGSIEIDNFLVIANNYSL